MLVSKTVPCGLRQPLSCFLFVLYSPPALSMQVPHCLQQSILFCTNMLQAEVGVFPMTCHVSARDSRGSIQVGCAGRFPPCPAELVQVLPCVQCDGHALAFSSEWDKVSQAFSFNSQISGSSSSRALWSAMRESLGCDLCTPFM